MIANSLSDEDLDEAENLINNAKHLIDKINETNKIIEEDQFSLDITDNEDISDEKISEYEKKLFPYLTKENLVLLLKTYKRLVSILNESGKSSQDISLNLEKKCCLMYENLPRQRNQLVRSNSETLLNDIKSVILKSNSRSQSRTDLSSEDLQTNQTEEDAEQNLSKNLIVTNVPIEVFLDFNLRDQFEKLFADLDHKCKFYYFKSFKRCRIECDDFISALLVKIELDDIYFFNANLKVFITKPIVLKNSRPFLEPPRNEKTFLISPPSSPPVGWEQEFEDPPVVNYDLLAALSKLNPHEPCEIIKSQQNIPGIVVHPCTDHVELSADSAGKIKFIQTRRPPNTF